jgi:hypothetical protein
MSGLLILSRSAAMIRPRKQPRAIFTWADRTDDDPERASMGPVRVIEFNQ